MGAERFDQYHKGTDASTAFSQARDQAAYDHGHAGYTGTLAEKFGFEMRSTKPMTRKEASVFADAELDNDDHDKWGAAWCVPICEDGSSAVVGFLFYGYASS